MSTVRPAIFIAILVLGAGTALAQILSPMVSSSTSIAPEPARHSVGQAASVHVGVPQDPGPPLRPGRAAGPGARTGLAVGVATSMEKVLPRGASIENQPKNGDFYTQQHGDRSSK